MYKVSPVSFYGNGSETTGSIANRKNKPVECPTCGQVNFKGQEYSEKKGTSTTGILAGVVALAALTVIGLGYAGKTKALDKLSDGWVKNTLTKLKPAIEKCHEWCAFTKNKGIEYWGKIKNFFVSKKS